ncbi:hypothetical protein PUNSTDRAFT_83165, partial [Punctularia strigosozonata HHB-11173 SS5]|uniref:uncharacterized protein n=1 Tax=Punctularia strigosozonata (strain HHB-11173) TaxID=741275 RepID=UPI0004418334
MQRPTCVDTRVRSTKDAQKIIYAAYLGRLPAAHRRLDGEERAALRSGHSYAWEEKPNNQHTGQGMERWTEGKKWGPSRVRDDFLFYYEQWVSPSNLPPGAFVLSSLSRPIGTLDPSQNELTTGCLTKQTYSIQMKTPQGERKWHLNTYFTQATLDALGTIDDIPGVGDLVIPEG